MITIDVAGIRENLGALQTVLSKEIVTDAARSGAHIFRTPRDVSRTGRDGSTPRDVNTSIVAARLTPPIQIFHSTSDFPTRTGTQEIINPIGPAGPQWISKAKKLKTSINYFFAENRGPKPSFSKVVGCKDTADPRVDVNSRCGMNFGSDFVVTPNQNFVDFGIASVNTTDKLGSVSVPTTRVGIPKNSSDWLQQRHDFEEATADRVSETKENINYIKK